MKPRFKFITVFFWGVIAVYALLLSVLLAVVSFGGAA